MITIWLNQWFSTAYNIINLIRKNETKFRIIGTNVNPESPIMAVCDEWYQEPDLKGDEYIDFCLAFCKEHDVDVFMPRHEMVSISKNKQRFIDAGVRMMVDDYSIVSILNYKDRAYEAFKREKVGQVPDYRIVTDVEQFKTAYAELSGKYEKICFKFARDEGGMSYHLIDNHREDYASLFRHQSSRISFDAAVNALRERDSLFSIMMMQYLPDEEISVDCLKTPSGLITIPRVKGKTRIEKVHYDEQIVQTCNDLIDKFPLEQPCNIQFKYSEGIPYILEVNTRMSGGVQMGCAAAGINIPNIAVNKLLGIDKPWTDNHNEKEVTYIEMPLVLSVD